MESTFDARPAVRPRSRLWVYAPTTLLLVLIAGWSAFWLFASNRVGAVLDGLLADEAARGRVWTCPDRRVGGYPFRIEVSCAKPTYRGALAGRPAHGEVARVSAVAQIYQPSLVLAEITAPFTVAADDDSRTLTLDWSRLQLSAHMQGERLARFDLIARTPSLAARAPEFGTASGRADDLQLHVRQSPDRPPGEGDYDIALGLTNGTIPALDAVSGLPGPVALDTAIRVTATERLARGPGAIDAWRLDGGRIDLTGLKVTKGAASITATGSLTLDDARRPAGRIDASVAGLDPVLQRFGIPPATAALGGLLGGLLGGRRAPGAPAGALPLPIVLRDGRVSVGPLRLPVLLTPAY